MLRCKQQQQQQQQQQEEQGQAILLANSSACNWMQLVYDGICVHLVSVTEHQTELAITRGEVGRG